MSDAAPGRTPNARPGGQADGTAGGTAGGHSGRPAHEHAGAAGRPAHEALLVEGFLFGDRAALATVDGWILPVIRHRAWRLRASQEDLHQDIRFKLLGLFERGAFRGQSSLKTYVQAVAKHTCLDALRRAAIRIAAPIDDQAAELLPPSRDNPDEGVERSEQTALCYEVLSRLPQPCRHVFQRILEQERSYEEIAHELSISVGTVKSRLARCRDRAIALRADLLAVRRSRGRRAIPGTA